MKTKKSLLVVPAIALVFALTIAACDSGGGGGGGNPSGGPTISTGSDGTPGLAFELIKNGTAYRVRKGTVKSGKVVIPAYYSETTKSGRMFRSAEDEDGLPVEEIGSVNDEPGNGAFEGTDITEIVIPDTVTEIGWGAFYECPNLKSITIPASVTEISRNAFQLSWNLTKITVAADNPNYSSEGGILYDISGKKNDYYGDLGDKVLHSYPSASGSVIITEGVTSIGEGAFFWCTNLTSVTIPLSVTKILTDAFNSTGLTSITIHSGVTNIGSGAFSSCENLTSVTIHEGVTRIGSMAFDNCKKLSAITIPASVTYVGYGAFIGSTNLTNITVAAGNPEYSSEGGILFNKDKSEIIAYPSTKGSVTTPVGVTRIGFQAFRDCTALTTITILSGVTFIRDYAFAGCESLTSVTIPLSVTTIDVYAFGFCKSISVITIPAGVMSVDKIAFSGWTSSQTINIQGKADRAATITAGWDSGWDASCSAVIVYQP